MATKEITVPDIGDFTDIPIIEVLVEVGQQIQADDSLITLESDKATMEVPAPEGGTVKEIKVNIGDKVSEGSLVLLLETSAEVAATTETPATEEPAPVAAANSGTIEVKVPDIGDFTDVPIIEILVEAGQQVQANDSLITLESDKATMEVPSPVSGTVQTLKVSIGDKVSEGSLIMLLSGGETTATAAAVPQPATAPAPVAPAPAALEIPPSIDSTPPPSIEATKVDEVGFNKAYASPSVRKFARELGVDLGKITGSGRKGRIQHEDIQAYVKGSLKKLDQPLAAPTAATAPAGAGIPEVPVPDFSKFGEIETKPLSRIKKISGTSLHRSWLNVPHVTQFDKADITELEAYRKSLKETAEKRGVKVTMLAFLIKASVGGLKAYPDFNASLDASKENLIYKKYYHVGVAVDTPNGLVVPVVKDADRKGLFDIASDLAELSKKARDGKLGPKDMQGATFTISSLGGIGGTAFTPIVNAPEVAILGVSRSTMEPVYQNGEFVPRLMLPLSLSYDHRVIDGAAAARFTSHLSFILSDVRNLLL